MLRLKLQYFGHLMPKELTHWKRPWCWEGLGTGGEGDDRGWDGWMASPTQWTWVWVNSGSWWWTWWPGVLRFMGSQRVGHDWATELNRDIFFYGLWYSIYGFINVYLRSSLLIINEHLGWGFQVFLMGEAERIRVITPIWNKYSDMYVCIVCDYVHKVNS